MQEKRSALRQEKETEKEKERARQAVLKEEAERAKREANTKEQLQQIQEIEELRRQLAETLDPIRRRQEVLREDFGKSIRESLPLFAMVALSTVVVVVWFAMGAYDVFKAMVLPRERHTEHALFLKWVSSTCSKSYLHESLICQLTHMDKRGEQPMNWLVRQLALLKVRERGVDFCPDESAARGLINVTNQHLAGFAKQLGLLAAKAFLGLDAEQVLLDMANGEIGLSKLSNRIEVLSIGAEKFIKSILKNPLAAWGIKLADIKGNDLLKCRAAGQDRGHLHAWCADRAFSLMLAALCALLSGIELMAGSNNRARGSQGNGPVTAPARLLGAAVKFLKSAVSVALDWISGRIVMTWNMVLTSARWRDAKRRAAALASPPSQLCIFLLLLFYKKFNSGEAMNSGPSSPTDRPRSLRGRRRGILGCCLVLVGIVLLLAALTPWLVLTDEIFLFEAKG